MHMMQRQKQWDHILTLPFPSLDQRSNLRGDIAMRGDNSFWLTRCATSKYNHGTTLRRERGERGSVVRAAISDYYERDSQAIT